MRRFVVIALLVLTGACREVTGPTVFYDQDFALSPGEEAHLVNTRTYIAFDGVAGDSRCPADAICVTGGDAQVKIRVIADGRAAAYDLHTGDMKPIVHQDLTVALVQLSPYPFSASPIAPNDYRATIKVTKAE